MRKSGYVFTPFEAPNQSPFEKLFDVFSELITHTSGDVDEALDWLNILDKEYNLTSEDYTMDDFIEDLKKKGYLREEIQPDGQGQLSITAKTERVLRKNAMDQILETSEKMALEITNPKKVDKVMSQLENFAIFNLAIHWRIFPSPKV
jgi:hypothetical protein